MKFNYLIYILTLFICVNFECKNSRTGDISKTKIRQLVDTVGFAQYPWQMDTIMARIDRKGWKKTDA